MRTRATGWAVVLVLVLLPAVARAQEPADIRCHAIVEAPVSRVWPMIANGTHVSKWLVHRAEEWTPIRGRTFRVEAHGGRKLAGRFLAVEPERGMTLAWPDPETVLKIELTPLDAHLTMVSLTHSGWIGSDDDALRRRGDAEEYWRAALMMLHRQFPPPVVDTQMHRPNMPGLFIARSLIVNGDFELDAPGRYEGVAFGWETNSARSSPQVHAVDDKVAHAKHRSQRIARPPDWTHFAVQQFTPHVVPLIEPGRRYRLTAWVRAEGIRNPAGWYTVGLWFIDAAGKPIGEPIKNARLTDADGNTVLEHDWRRVVVEAEAPPGATRAVVILTGHWDDQGTVWYDDITLWEVEPPPTTHERPR